MTAPEETLPCREFSDEEKSALETILAILNQEAMLYFLHDGLKQEVGQ